MIQTLSLAWASGEMKTSLRPTQKIKQTDQEANNTNETQQRANKRSGLVSLESQVDTML